jgi:hypothetical protein
MKNLPIVIALFFAAIFTSSCAFVYYYKPAGNQPETTKLTYNHGMPNLTGSTGDCEITAEVLTRSNSNFLDLGLYFRNLTDSSITFLPEEVVAYGYNKAGKSKKLSVYTAKEFIRNRNTRNAIIAGTIVAVAVATAIAAEHSGGSGNNGNEGNFNNFWFPAPPVIVAPVVAPGVPIPHAAHDGLLRQHTMLAQEGLAGNIKVRKNPNFSEKLLIEVPINGRYVKFTFDGKERRW